MKVPTAVIIVWLCGALFGLTVRAEVQPPMWVGWIGIAGFLAGFIWAFGREPE